MTLFFNKNLAFFKTPISQSSSKLLTKAKLGVLLLYSSLPSLFAIPINRTQVISQIGIPTGGSDFCGSNLPFCEQGYITSENQTQFSVSISKRYGDVPCNSENFDLHALSRCIDLNDLGMMINDLKNESSLSNLTRLCQLASHTLGCWRLNISTTNIPTVQCAPLKHEISERIDNCLDRYSQLGYLIAGVIIGLFLICISACIYCVIKKQDKPREQVSIEQSGAVIIPNMVA